MLPVLIQRALRDLQRGGSKKSALAKELRASPLLEATWTRCDLEANPPVNSARSTWATIIAMRAPAEGILPRMRFKLKSQVEHALISTHLKRCRLLID